MHYDATEALPEFVFDVDLDRPIPSLKTADAEPPALLFPKTAGWLTGETVSACNAWQGETGECPTARARTRGAARCSGE